MRFNFYIVDHDNNCVLCYITSPRIPGMGIDSWNKKSVFLELNNNFQLSYFLLKLITSIIKCNPVSSTCSVLIGHIK